MQTTRLLLPLAAAGLIGGAGGAVVTSELADPPAAVRAADTTAGDTRTIADVSSPALAPSEIYARTKDSVAHISAEAADRAFGQPSAAGAATGSGFVISADGLVVTNAHVIDGAGRIFVRVGDGERTRAELVGSDPSTDIALLRVDVGESELQPLELADSDTLQVGDATYAIGNPYGLDRTLTGGLVSALQRTIEAPNGYAIANAIQTDAILNPGNSGGPLLDDRGRVVGVNSQIRTSGGSPGAGAGNTGLGFAVASNTVTRIVEQLRENGEATHPYLGIATGDADGSSAGAVVRELVPSGPAAAAGVRAGDVITRLGDEAIDGSEALISALTALRPDDAVTLEVRRGDRAEQIEVKLGTRPAAEGRDSLADR